MKKIIFVLIIVVTVHCPESTNAQQATLKAQRDSLQLLFDDALVMLDSIIGKNMDLSKQVVSLNSQVSNLKAELNNVLRQKNETATELAKAKKLLSDQMKTIENLEAEVKRLSQAKKPQ